MSKTIKQPADLGALPVLRTGEEMRKRLRIGHNKWNSVQYEVGFILVGRQKRFTDEMAAAYLKRRTRQPQRAR